jgi:hypothetical protein
MASGAGRRRADDEFGAFTDAHRIADPAPGLPTTARAADWESRVVDSVAAASAPTAIEQVRRRLSERLDWVWATSGCSGASSR